MHWNFFFSGGNKVTSLFREVEQINKAVGTLVTIMTDEENSADEQEMRRLIAEKSQVQRHYWSLESSRFLKITLIWFYVNPSLTMVLLRSEEWMRALFVPFRIVVSCDWMRIDGRGGASGWLTTFRHLPLFVPRYDFVFMIRMLFVCFRWFLSNKPVDEFVSSNQF